MPPKCSTCNITFPNASSKKKHDRETHEHEILVNFKDRVSRKVIRQNGLFSCSCGYSSRNSNNFRMHGQVHVAPPLPTVADTAVTAPLPTVATVAPVLPIITPFPGLGEVGSAGTIIDPPVAAPSVTPTLGVPETPAGHGLREAQIPDIPPIPPIPEDIGVDDDFPAPDDLPGQIDDAPVLCPPTDPAEIPVQPPLEPPPQSSPQMPPPAPSPSDPASQEAQVVELEEAQVVELEEAQAAELEEGVSDIKRRRIGDVANMDVDIEGIDAAAAAILLYRPQLLLLGPTTSIHSSSPPIWTKWKDYGDAAFISRMAKMTSLELPNDPEVFVSIRKKATQFISQSINYIGEAPDMFRRKLLTSVGAVSKEMLVIEDPAAIEAMFLRYVLFLFRICTDDFPLEEFQRCRAETSHHMWQVRNVLIGITKADITEKRYLQYLGVFAGSGYNTHAVNPEAYQTSCILNFVNLMAWEEKRKGFVTGQEMYDLLYQVDVMARVIAAGLTLLQYGDHSIKNGSAPIISGRPDPNRNFQDYELLSVDGAFGLSALSRSLHLMQLVGFGQQELASSETVTLGDLRKAYVVSLADVDEKLKYMSFGVELPLDLASIYDDVPNVKPGYSFATELSNLFDRNYLERVAQKDKALLAKVIPGGTLSGEFYNAYSSYYSRTLELIATVIAICCGETFEPEDCARLILENGGGYSRSFYVHGGNLFLVWRVVGTEEIRMQVLPKEFAAMVCKVIIYVVPFLQWMKDKMEKSPLDWAHPLLPRTFFTVSTRAIPGSSIRTIVRGQSKVIKADLTPKLLQDTVLRLKDQQEISSRIEVSRRLDLLAGSLRPKFTVITARDLENEKGELEWLGDLFTEVSRMERYKSADTVHIRGIHLAVKRSGAPMKRIVNDMANFNSSCSKDLKGLLFVRSAAAVKMIMGVGTTSVKPYQLVDVEKEAKTLDAWLQDPVNHILIAPFSQFESLKCFKEEIGWIVHCESCGDINILLEHCKLPHKGLRVYVTRESEFSGFATSKEEALMSEWLNDNCRKKFLYWQMGFEGGNCHEEGAHLCDYCEEHEEFEFVKKALQTIATSGACGFCLLHRTSITHHSNQPNKICPYQKDLAELSTVTRAIKFRTSFVEGCCKVCGLPASWCPDKCQYKALPALLCASAILDPEITKKLAKFKIEPGRKIADFLLNGGSRNGMVLVLKVLLQGGYLKVPKN
ncbi:hypothetical protein TWF281_003039 [Arthrobotrys megalospora]